jgi:hypothetical protein
MENAMKRISNIAPALTLVCTIIAFAIAVYSGKVVSAHDEAEKAHPSIVANSTKAIKDHNNNEKAHPAIVASIEKNKSEVQLLAQKIDSNQVINAQSDRNIEAGVARLLETLDKMESRQRNQ